MEIVQVLNIAGRECVFPEVSIILFSAACWLTFIDIGLNLQRLTTTNCDLHQTFFLKLNLINNFSLLYQNSASRKDWVPDFIYEYPCLI